MAEDKIQAQVNQQMHISVDITVEDKRKYSFYMPYGASFGEAHAVSLEITNAIVQMAENAKKQEEEKTAAPKEEDAQE